MSDHDALLAAICAEPDEDTPRLAFADWLDENDQPAHAAFVRDQIELARTPDWEPYAVMCRWRWPDRVTGKPFLATLPRVDGSQVKWHDVPFSRGFGWRLNVPSLVAWQQTESRIVGRVPVGEMHFWAGTLDDWLRLAESPILPQLRKLHFANSPIEPLRTLRDRPQALGITDIHFDRASGAGMPVVIEDLFRAPLGQAVRGLHLRVGCEPIEDLIDAFRTGPALERLSFSLMGLTPDYLRRLCDGPTLSRLSELNLADEPLGSAGVRVLAGSLPASLRSLRLSQTGGQAEGLEALAGCENLAGLRRLDLSRNPLAPRAARVLATSRVLAGLRSLDLRGCRIGDKGVRRLTRAKFWPNLVELDLRGNPMSAAGVEQLLDAEVPADLAALVLSDELGASSRNELQGKYGERVIFAGE